MTNDGHKYPLGEQA